MRAAYRVRISPQDVGRRVTVRRRIPAGGGMPSTTDVVGVLRAWEAGALRVQRRDGVTVQIPASDVVAARVIPDRPRPPGR